MSNGLLLLGVHRNFPTGGGGGGGGIAFVQSNYTQNNDYDPNVTHAMTSNVTAGNLLVCIFHAGYHEGHTPDVGDLTKSAGTATIGTVKMNVSQTWTFGDQMALITYSVPITGSGSLTMAHALDSNGVAKVLECSEFSGDWTSHVIDGTNSGASAGANEATVQSGTVASSGESLFIGASITEDGSWTSVTLDSNFTALHDFDTSSANAWFRSGYRIANATDQIEWAIVNSTINYWRAQLTVCGEG